MRIIFRLAAVLAATLLLAGPLPAPNFYPTEPRVHVAVAFYDTGGRNGIVEDGTVLPNAPPLNASLEVFINGDYSNPYATRPWWFYSVSTPADMVGGDPFYARLYQPLIGCLSTGGYIGEATVFEAAPVFPEVIIPIDLTDTGYERSPSPILGSDRDYSNLHFSLYVADSRTTPGLYVDLDDYVEWLPFKSGRVRVEYLAGSALYGAAPTTINIDEVAGNAVHNLRWGPDQPTGSNTLDGGPLHPDGPIRITTWVEGFTSDTITIDLPANWSHQWKALLTPDGGDSIVTRFPPPDLLAIGVTGTLLSDCPPIAGLAPAFDPNRDGINDAADMLWLGL